MQLQDRYLDRIADALETQMGVNPKLIGGNVLKPNIYRIADALDPSPQLLADGTIKNPLARIADAIENGTLNIGDNVSSLKPVNNVITGITTPENNQGSDGNVYLKCILSEYSIPGYTCLDYISTSGNLNQYIDTGVFPNTVGKIEVEVSLNSTPETHACIFGSCASLSTGDQALTLSYESPGNFAAVTGLNVVYALYGISLNTYYKYTFEITNDAVPLVKHYVDDVFQGSNNRGTLNSTYTIWLFRCHHNFGDSYARPVNAKIKSLNIYDSNNDLIRKYIPAMSNDSEKSGLYDLINETFVSSGGNVELLPGNKLIDGCIFDAYYKLNGVWQPLIGSIVQNNGS